MNSKRRIWLILGLVLPFVAFGASQLQPAAITPKFAYNIPVAAVHAQLAPGYFLLITSVRGDRPQFEPGGTYLIQGRYRLGPGKDAVVAAITRSANSHKVTFSRMEPASAGTGHMRLVAKLEQGGPILVAFLDPAQNRANSDRTRGTFYVLDSQEAAAHGLALDKIKFALDVTVKTVPSDEYRAWNGSTTSSPLAPMSGVPNFRPLP